MLPDILKQKRVVSNSKIREKTTKKNRRRVIRKDIIVAYFKREKK